MCAAQVINTDELFGFLRQVAFQLIIEAVQLLLPPFKLQFLDDLIQRLNLFQIFLGTDQNQLFLCSGDRHVQSLQILQQDTFISGLLGTRNDHDIGVNTL
jgi:hypothetical protein